MLHLVRRSFRGILLGLLLRHPILPANLLPKCPQRSKTQIPSVPVFACSLIIPPTLAAIAQGFACIVPIFWLIGGSASAIGSDLFYTMNEATGTGKWIRFQIIVGFAVGLPPKPLCRMPKSGSAQQTCHKLLPLSTASSTTSLTNPHKRSTNNINYSLPDCWRSLFPLRRLMWLQEPARQAFCPESASAQPRRRPVHWHYPDPHSVDPRAGPHSH